MIKITGGRFKNRKLTSYSNTLRPSSSILRQALFNILQEQIQNCSFLDLFAGSGAVGLEALSRGANFVVFVENQKSLPCLRKNIEILEVKETVLILNKDAFRALPYLQKKGLSFDIIFLDPPYPLFSSCPEKIEKLVAKSVGSLKKEGQLFLEHPSTFKPFEINNLIIKKSHKFGISTLTHYYLTKK